MQFDLNEGVQVQTFEEIRTEKKALRESTFGITITDSPTSVYSNVDYVNSKGQEALQLKIQALDQKLKTFFTDLQNRITNVNVSTYQSVLEGLKKLDYIDQVSLQIPTGEDTRGIVTIYILLKDTEEYSDERLVEVATTIHNVLPVGTFTATGDDANTGEAIAFNGQKVNYSWFNPSVQYAYLKIVYTQSNDSYLGFQTDSSMREALKSMIEAQGYNQLGKDFEWQEFVCPAMSIQGVGQVDIYLHKDSDPTKDISSLTDSDFETVNKNEKIELGEILLFDIDQRTLITIPNTQGE